MSTDEERFTMAYLDSAETFTVLLIHGFPLSSSLWLPQIEDLGDVARVIAPDLRGHGFSDATTPPYTMAMYADDCAHLLDSLGVDEPVVVGGLSMGGYIAFEFFRRYPERVLGLILTATRAAADSAEAQANRDKAAADVQARGVGPLVDGMLPKLLAPDTLAHEEELVAFVREMMVTNSVDGVVGALAAMRDRLDSTPTLPTIDVPTLVIHGSEDQIVPVAEARAMADAIPGAQFELLSGAGHLPNLEQSGTFNRLVAQFLFGLFYEEEGGVDGLVEE